MPSLCRVTLPVSTDWFNPSIAHQHYRSSTMVTSLAIHAACNYRAITFGATATAYGRCANRPNQCTTDTPLLSDCSNSTRRITLPGTDVFSVIPHPDPSHR